MCSVRIYGSRQYVSKWLFWGGGLMTGELGGCSRQQIFRFINYVYAQKLA